MTTSIWIPDHSAVQCFRENPEAFRLKYRQHLRTPTPETHFGAGHALHGARNVLFTARKEGVTTYTPELIDKAAEVARTLRGDAPGRRGAEQCERIVRAYAARYAHEEFRVTATEEYAEARIGEGCTYCSPPRNDGKFKLHLHYACPGCGSFMFCGILDAAIAFPDGAEHVFDLKSTGSYLNEAWDMCMRLSDQFVGYVALRRATGHRCDGYYVDGIHFTDPKARKDGSYGEAKVDLEKDFVRVGPVPVPDWRVQRWAANMKYTLAQIDELERTRGVDVPWPMYQNWSYGKVDEYKDFYLEPAELHAQTALTFERKPWTPREVAEERKVS